MAIPTPVIVGVAQINQRSDVLGDDRKEPYELMIQAVRDAARDASCRRLLEDADSVRVIRGAWRYQNPARAVAEALGNVQAETCLTPYGGNCVGTTVRVSAEEIQAGKRNIVVITGAECGYSRALARRAGTKLNWKALEGSPDRNIGEDVPLSHPREVALKIQEPTVMYPIFENALRHQRGQTIEEHLIQISELWARFSVVAAGNPHAWIREAKSAEEIRTASAFNRPVSFPYPKFMNSNSSVDQAAALIMTSTETARALGIPPDKWIYPWVGTYAHDEYFVSNRDNLHSSPAIRYAGARAFELADMSPADVDRVDLYSCFPVAVQISASELGLSDKKPLTVTGGNTWAGGPLNDYVMHSTATMVEVLRANPGERGLVTAVGGYMTKHELCIYSTEPPARPFQTDNLQTRVDETPSRELADGHWGTATVEGYTAMYDGNDPAVAYLSALIDDGRRVWGVCEDRDTVAAMTREEFCGRALTLTGTAARF